MGHARAPSDRRTRSKNDLKALIRWSFRRPHFFAGHLGDLTVSNLFALGSCSMQQSSAEFHIFYNGVKNHALICINEENVMNHLDSKMEFILL